MLKVEALRVKLEQRTESIEKKAEQLQSTQTEKNRLQSEMFDLSEQLRIRDSKTASIQRKVRFVPLAA